MADPAFAFQAGQQTVDLSILVKKCTESTFLAFKDLCDISPERSDTEKKIGLLKFINKTRQRLLRLLVLSKWCSQIPLVKSCQQLVGTLSNHDTSFVQAADSLFFLHEELQQARAPMYDIPSAIEVLLTGGYKRLPKCIEDLGLQPALSGDEEESTLQKLDTMLRSQLLDVPLPKEVSSVKVANGMVTLLVDDEFEAQLTLGYRGNPSLWRVLHLKILVGENGRKLKLTSFQEASVKDDLERRMACLEDPLQILYSVLHEFCTAWVMDIIIRQVHALQKGRWKDAIRIEFIQEGSSGTSVQPTTTGMGMTVDAEADIGSGKSHFSPGLKVVYWLDVLKGVEPPFLRIEQGADHNIGCCHVPQIVDFENDYDAQFQINLTSIDVENLLLRTILCNIHTRLLEVYRALRNSSQLCRTDSDVILHTLKTKETSLESFLNEDGISEVGEVGEEVLSIRAYAQCYFALAINIRTGRFILRSHNLSLPANLLAETEDALSQGLLSPLDAFISLRNKSLLQLYASIGTTLNLKLNEKGTLRFKKSTEGPKLGADSVVMGFPSCRDTFFLILQLDSNFIPVIMLVEGQPQQTSAINGPVHILRYINITSDSFFVTDDEMDFCFLDENPQLARHGRDGLAVGLKEGDIKSRLLESPANKILGTGTETDFMNKSEDIGVYVNQIPDSTKLKRKMPDSVLLLPSLKELIQTQAVKRRKTTSESFSKSTGPAAYCLPDGSASSVGQPYSVIIARANEGKASLSAYTAFLLRVIRRCSVCIKQARLASQMSALGIPFIEEVGLHKPSTNIWFRLHPSKDGLRPGVNIPSGWEHACLCLGKPGCDEWSVKIRDVYMRDLYDLEKQKNSAQLITSEVDSHIQCTSEGVVLHYEWVDDNSIKNMLKDLERLWNARTFALGMKHLLENKMDEKGEIGQDRILKSHQFLQKGLLSGIEVERTWDGVRRSFRVEAIGLTSVWFTYIGSVIARFVVEWGKEKRGCTMHVSPDQLWPHTKYLEEYIDGQEVELLLDCIRVTAGPLHALAGAIRPARMPVAPPSVASVSSLATAGPSKTSMVGHVVSPSNASIISSISQGRILPSSLQPTNNVATGSSHIQSPQNGAVVSGPGRGTGLVPSSLLPTDVSVVLRSPFWIRIIYRRQFAVDMRCFAGDQVWLQPAPPPRGFGSGIKGSLPCPQFRPFVMEQITTGYGSVDSTSISGAVSGQSGHAGSSGMMGSASQILAQGSNRANAGLPNATRAVLTSTSQPAPTVLRVGAPQSLASNSMASARIIPGMSIGFHPSHRELNTAGYGFSDDGGYGGVWVPLGLGCLKKVLRGTLRYLGVVWLFAQFPNIIKEVLATHLKENEGALLHHDPDTPSLRFYIQNCVFAVSVHRQQLVLQAINVKRYHQPQAPQQQQAQSQQSQSQAQSQQSGSENELSVPEMQEIGDFFARRAAFEPYDASRLASFVTMLTLPVPVLREFINLIAWKKDAAKASQHVQGSDLSQTPRPKIELCLEKRTTLSQDSVAPEESNLPSTPETNKCPKSNIDYDLSRGTVDFTLTVIFDPIHVPHMNVAGGAGWLPQCVAVRLRYTFGDGNSIVLLDMEGSHGGRACWSRVEDWEKCKEKVSKAVELAGNGNTADQAQGRLRVVAETVQTTLQSALQQLRKGSSISSSTLGSL